MHVSWFSVVVLQEIWSGKVGYDLNFTDFLWLQKAALTLGVFG